MTSQPNARCGEIRRRFWRHSLLDVRLPAWASLPPSYPALPQYPKGQRWVPSGYGTDNSLNGIFGRTAPDHGASSTSGGVPLDLSILSQRKGSTLASLISQPNCIVTAPMCLINYKQPSLCQSGYSAGEYYWRYGLMRDNSRLRYSACTRQN